MKALLPLLLMCFIFYSSKAQSIHFKHEGNSDKPMPDFYIQSGAVHTYELTPAYESLITTDPKIFESLATYITDNNPRPYGSNTVGKDFGTYWIIYIKEEHNLVSYHLSKADAKTFFKKILPLVKSHPELYSDVEKIIKRLG